MSAIPAAAARARVEAHALVPEPTASLDAVDNDVSSARVELPLGGEAAQAGWYDVNEILHSVLPTASAGGADAAAAAAAAATTTTATSNAHAQQQQQPSAQVTDDAAALDAGERHETHMHVSNDAATVETATEAAAAAAARTTKAAKPTPQKATTATQARILTQPQSYLKCDLCNAIFFDKTDGRRNNNNSNSKKHDSSRSVSNIGDDTTASGARDMAAQHTGDDVIQAHMAREHRELLQQLALGNAAVMPTHPAYDQADDEDSSDNSSNEAKVEMTSKGHGNNNKKKKKGKGDRGSSAAEVAAAAAAEEERRKAAAKQKEDDTNYLFATYALELVRDADGGPAMFAVIQSAQEQLCTLLSTTMPSKPLVFLFGSCVSMGIWDGCGDADFSAVVDDILKKGGNNNNNNNNSNVGAPSIVPPPAPSAMPTRVSGVVLTSHDDAQAAAAAAAASDNNGDNSNNNNSSDDAHNDDNKHDSADGDGADVSATPSSSQEQQPEQEQQQQQQQQQGQEHTRSTAADSKAAMARAAAAAVAMLSKRMEATLITEMARKLRSVGFHFDELDLVLGARTPVLRRARAAKRPHVLWRNDEPYSVEVYIAHAGVRERFRAKEAARAGRVYAGAYIRDSDVRGAVDLIEFAHARDALHFFRRRDGDVVQKRWLRFSRLPELFSVDFDLSCRTLGVRNSWFLRAYLAQHAAFRVGNVMLKRWSKQCGINYPRQGYLTSYAVSILWVYYLLRTGAAKYVDPQSVPAVPTRAQLTVPYMPLWPVDHPAPPSIDGASTATDAHKSSSSSEKDDEDSMRNYRYLFSANTRAMHYLGQLLRGFFAFYAAFDWDAEVVTLRRDCSPRGASTDSSNHNHHDNNSKDDEDNRHVAAAAAATSAVLTRPADLGWVADAVDTLKLSHRVYYRICIEDIYEDDLNLGRHLTPVKAAWLKSQFVRAAACCAHAKHFDILLDDCHRRAEAVLRVQLRRYLLSCADGSATVAQLREHLRAGNAALLATYELRHRLSELWCDEAIRARDARHALHVGKQQQQQQQQKDGADGAAVAASDGAAAMTTVTLLQRPELWDAVCVDDVDDEDDADNVAAGDARVVRLASASVNYHVTPVGGDDATAAAAAVAARLHDTLQRCQHMYEVLMVQLQLPSTRRAGAVVDAADHLLKLMFYTVDGTRVFATYDARANFTRHLRQVALALEEQHAIAVMKWADVTSVLDSKQPPGKGGKSTQGNDNGNVRSLAQQDAQRRGLATVVLHRTVAGNDLDEGIVRSIVQDTMYVVYNARTHVLERTPLLYDYAGHIAVEGEVERVKRSYATPRMRRNIHEVNTGVCTGCGVKDRLLYPTTTPNLDNGRYCMHCWDTY